MARVKDIFTLQWMRSSRNAVEKEALPGNESNHHVPPPFPERYRRALDDLQLRRNLLNFQRSWRVARDKAFGDYLAEGKSGEVYGEQLLPEQQTDGYEHDFESMRHRMAAYKDEVLNNHEQYIEQFKEAARRNGIIIYEATTAEDANRYVLDLVRRRNIHLVAKSKSMVSEEIGMNAVLEEIGVEPVETDLGEWIVQLAHERPSHMVMPAIHKNRLQVADLFEHATGQAVSREDIGAQVELARETLRQEFLAAGVGISGANALVSESGAVMFICNEGNARLVTSLPRLHVVLAGIEKLVPNYEAAMLQVRLLARSATCQPITAYTTFITGPTEPDKEMHIVLIDNGRRRMRELPMFKDALRCIRCAACANVCPSYQVVGGHVFGYIYSGAIGLVNTPFHNGLEADAGPQSLCVSCNACATVCPVEIPLPQQILEVRTMVTEEQGLPPLKKALIGVWSNAQVFRVLTRMGAAAQAPLTKRIGAHRFLNFQRMPWIPADLKTLTDWRRLPALAPIPARQKVKPLLRTNPRATMPSKVAGMTIAYFVQCLTDVLYPNMATSTVKILKALGCKVVYPEQHCCGLVAYDAGDKQTAKHLAKQTIESLEKALNDGADYIVTHAASCAIAMEHDYDRIFADEPDWIRRSKVVSEKTLDLITFLDKVAQLQPGSLKKPENVSITYHNFCQSGNVLKLHEEPRRLLRDVLGIELREMAESNVCCGFGGSVSMERPEMCEHILNRKLNNIEESGAPVVVTDNPGCIMHMRGGIAAQGKQTRVMHIAELIAQYLPE